MTTGSWGDGLYNAFEFVVFLIPRVIQLLIDPITTLYGMEPSFAMSIYTGLSLLCAAGLAAAGCFAFRSAVRGQVLVINRETAQALFLSMALFGFATFTALAPSSGLSLKHCAKTVASFVTVRT